MDECLAEPTISEAPHLVASLGMEMATDTPTYRMPDLQARASRHLPLRAVGTHYPTRPPTEHMALAAHVLLEYRPTSTLTYLPTPMLAGGVRTTERETTAVPEIGAGRRLGIPEEDIGTDVPAMMMRLTMMKAHAAGRAAGVLPAMLSSAVTVGMTVTVESGIGTFTGDNFTAFQRTFSNWHLGITERCDTARRQRVWTGVI